MSVEKREVSFDTREKANVLRHVGRGRKNLPGVGTTFGEWAGVVQLERAKAKRILPPRRPDRIRKAKVGR
jgi:hypothetical protein